MINQAVNLNLIPGQVLPRVNVSQYDYGSRTLEFKLFNGNQSFTLTSSMTANISGTKADMHGFEYDATVDTTNQKIVADLTQQMTATAGDVTCELIIKKSGERLGTCNFVISVEKAALGDDIIISDTELPAIIAEATAQMEAAAQSASEAASSAQAAEESADKAEAYGTHPPYIGANGNWFVYNVTTQQYEDSGVKAQGPLSGLTDVEITNAQDGQEITYDGTTQKWKNTSKIQTLTNQVKDMNNVLGAKNLLPNNATTQTINGVTFIVNDDGTITMNGTQAGGTTWIYVLENTDIDRLSIKVGDELILSGGVNQKSRLALRFFDSSLNQLVEISSRGGDSRFTVPSNSRYIAALIVVNSGQTVTNEIIKPMLRLASITDNTYVPYAKTNRELTEDAEDSASQIQSLLNEISILKSNGNWHTGLRFKNLGTSFTTAQQTALANGDFSEFWNGDYWVIGGHNWRIVDNSGIARRKGDTNFDKNSLIIMPDDNLIASEAFLIDDSDSSGHGYSNCAYRTRTDGKGREECKSIIASAFGSSHIASHREMISSSRGATGVDSWSWTDADVELPSEVNLYGHTAFSAGIRNGSYSPGCNIGTEWGQFMLFRLAPYMAINRSQNCWLRDIASVSLFAAISSFGNTASLAPATSYIGLRPFFILIAN